MEQDPFAAWDKELVAETKGAVRVADTVDFAQNLQLGMLDAKPEHRFEMGMMALELLANHPNPLQHKDYVINTTKAYLTIHENPETHQGMAFRYGGMRLAGRVGHYTLDKLENEWILALQMFEPTQLAVDSEQDRIYARLPAPLMVPVTAIQPPFFPYR